jgi:hypothetical protein
MILSQNKNLVPINTVVQQKEMSNIPTPVAEYNTVMTDPTKKIEMLPIEIKDQTLLDNCAILPINEKSLIPQVVTTGGNTDITVIGVSSSICSFDFTSSIDSFIISSAGSLHISTLTFDTSNSFTETVFSFTLFSIISIFSVPHHSGK